VNDLSGWVLWALPLMIAEILIQMRKLRRIRRPAKSALSLDGKNFLSDATIQPAIPTCDLYL
jgi:hypothetical protein